jgi:DNA-binding NarL/FixJ family response regulator
MRNEAFLMGKETEVNRSKNEQQILIAGAFPLVRSALASLINRAGYRVDEHHYAGSAGELLNRIRRDSVDLVFLIYDTASGFGLNLIEQIRAEKPDLPLLVLNSSPSDREAMAVIRAHVTGYLGRQSTPQHLVQALRKTLSGHCFVSPEIAQTLLFKIGSGMETEPMLSSREAQVLSLISQGKKRATIAETLYLSPQTISSYRTRILEKLGVNNDAALIRYAVEHRLV